jgi:hypothetical protein
MRHTSDLVFVAIGAGEAVLAILLQPLMAGGAAPAAIDEAADANQIANLEFGNLVSYSGHAAHDFVSGNKGILGVAPFVAGHVDVGVADAAIKDADHNIAGTRLAALERERRKLACGGMGGVAMDMRCHFALPFCYRVIALSKTEVLAAGYRNPRDPNGLCANRHLNVAM